MDGEGVLKNHAEDDVFSLQHECSIRKEQTMIKVPTRFGIPAEYLTGSHDY